MSISAICETVKTGLETGWVLLTVSELLDVVFPASKTRWNWACVVVGEAKSIIGAYPRHDE
jgi:hypothetical protein